MGRISPMSELLPGCVHHVYGYKNGGSVGSVLIVGRGLNGGEGLSGGWLTTKNGIM